MTQTWKFSIKPDTSKDAFEKCKELGIVGIGWSHGYENKQPKDYEEAKSITKDYWKKDIRELRKIYEEIKSGDHLWMHKNGHYYLCVAGDERLFARDICSDFRNYDLGHAITAKWIEIPDEFVCGAIQRGVIARRMIQRIYISETDLKINQHLIDLYEKNKEWSSSIDFNSISIAISKISIDDLFSLLSPDDVEDIVASILQMEKWILIKSTCFRSKPKFEFSMINGEGNQCLVQVKSGSHPNRLAPSEYKQYLSKNCQIVLFSTHPDPYPGEQYSGIRCLSKQFVFEWILSNWMVLPNTIKLKIEMIKDDA